MRLEGAIFDMDGTLLDSMHVWNTMGTDYLLSRGITPREDFNAYFKTLSLRQAAEYYRREYGRTDSVQFIMDDVNALVRDAYFYRVQPKPFVPDYLERLRRAGVRMCVATATDRHLVEAALRRCGLLDFFLAVFTCTEVGAGKDRPDIYEHALSALGTDKRFTAVFEDSPFAIRTAAAAGFPVAGVKDVSYPDEQDFVRCASCTYITDYKELLDKEELL